jgi:phage-related protein
MVVKRYRTTAIIAKQRPQHPLWWVGSSRKDIRNFPEPVRHLLGRALQIVQQGGQPVGARQLKGFDGTSVFEISADSSGGTYRLVYFVLPGAAAVVLHAFQKKSRSGRQTPLHHIRLIKERLKRAEQEHASEIKPKPQADRQDQDPD